MGIGEIIGLVALKQIATAVKNVCDVGASNAGGPIAAEAWSQGAQIAGQVATAADKGLAAASGEFKALQDYETTVHNDEKSFGAWIQTLPLPTP